MRLDQLFDPARLREAWERKAEAPAAPEPATDAPPTPPPPTPAEVLLRELVAEARLEAGPLGAPGIDVLAADAAAHLARGEAGHAGLLETLDQLEDLLEACSCARPA